MESLGIGAMTGSAGVAPADPAWAAEMDAVPSQRRIAPSLAVRIVDFAAANRRVAGLSVAARWAARAGEAGQDVAIVVPDAARWPAATRDDFARTGVEPVLLSSVPAGVAVVDGRWLPEPAALRSATPGTPLHRADAIDLDDETTATRRILAATAKPSDGLVSRWLNRPVSQRISALLLRHAPGVRPSHMTGVVALVAVAMVLSLLFGGAKGLIAGGILFHLASVLDGVDGELARATYRSSPAGAALDTRVDMLTNIGYFLSIAVALTRLYGGHQALVGALAVVGALSGLAITAWLARRMGVRGSFDILKPYYRRRFPGGWQWWVTEILVTTTSRDFFAFAFGVVIVVGLGWAVSWLLLGFILAWLTAVVCAVPGVLRAVGAAPLTGISASGSSGSPIAAR